MVKEAEPSRWQGGSFVMRAVLFVNGDPPEPTTASRLARTADLVVAVDGGSRHALSLNIVPHVVIGDLDSLEPDLRVRLVEAGTRFLPYPTEKDETDLELALLYASEQGADEIFILGALGKRIDQTLANLLLLAHPTLTGIQVRIVAGRQEAFLIRDEASITGHPGDTVSLIPIGGDAHGVTTEGLKWTLADETLRLGPARGVSNVLLGREARVYVREGLLLCVVIHQSQIEEAEK